MKNNFNNAFIVQQDKMDPQFLIEMDEFRERLESAIQSIPEGAKEVFLLNCIKKLTYVQIVQNLGLSVKAIEKGCKKRYKFSLQQDLKMIDFLILNAKPVSKSWEIFKKSLVIG